jgi:hypothetical protein
MKIFERYGTLLRVYDNGGKSFDRYTVIPPRWAGEDWKERNGLFYAISASAHPFDPQGFGQHVSAMPGKHLGNRIRWNQLPKDVQKVARQTFEEFITGEFDSRY